MFNIDPHSTYSLDQIEALVEEEHFNPTSPEGESSSDSPIYVTPVDTEDERYEGSISKTIDLLIKYMPWDSRRKLALHFFGYLIRRLGDGPCDDIAVAVWNNIDYENHNGELKPRAESIADAQNIV